MLTGLPNTCSRFLSIVIGCGPPVTPAHPPDVTAAVPGALSSATAELYWRAWSGARRRSHRGPSSLTAMGEKRSLIPDSLNTVRPETRTIKGCSWERTSSVVSSQIKLREEEEEDEKHLEMRSGSPEGNLVKDVRSNLECVFWAGTMSAVCVPTVVSPSVTSVLVTLPSLF